MINKYLKDLSDVEKSMGLLNRELFSRQFGRDQRAAVLIPRAWVKAGSKYCLKQFLFF